MGSVTHQSLTHVAIDLLSTHYSWILFKCVIDLKIDTVSFMQHNYYGPLTLLLLSIYRTSRGFLCADSAFKVRCFIIIVGGHLESTKCKPIDNENVQLNFVATQLKNIHVSSHGRSI